MRPTEGHLLDGRISYAQPGEGFRSGIEPVLLAATIPARPGDRVLEAGCGAGAALLCLAARIPGLAGTGVEQDPELTRLAAANVAANGFADLEFLAGDVRSVALDGAFDHAFANPPYHDALGTRSPDAARERAKRGSAGLLAEWARALARVLRERGTLTFVLPAALLPASLEAMADAGCPASAILPLWPKAGVACKLMLVRGVKGGRAAFRLLPGVVLHEADGSFTGAATDVLRGGRGLELD